MIHAISRLVLHPVFKNIQASWTKLGPEGVRACLQAGVNDLGGTLMNETITRAAGASHGQETSPEEMVSIIESVGRCAKQRTTTYGDVTELQRQKSFGARALVEPTYTSAKKYDRTISGIDKKKGKKQGKKQLYRPGLEVTSDEDQLSSADII